MKKSEFEKLAQGGIQQIPKKFRNKLSNVVITIEDSPSQTQLRKLNLPDNQLLFGLYQGIPQTKRGFNYNLVLPDKITIFQKPIESLSESSEEIRQIVRQTIWHEIAHHFGIDERRIREIELRREEKKVENLISLV